MNPAPPSRLVALVLSGLALCLSWLSLSAVRRNLAPEARALLAAQLRLPFSDVEIERAVVHPFGELRLLGLRVRHPAASLSAREATVQIDLLRALRGQLVPRRVSFLDVRAAGFAAHLALSAARATLHLQGGGAGEGRLLLHALEVEGLPRRFAPRAAHLSAELHRSGPKRVALSGVFIGPVGPFDLLLRGADGGVQLRGAINGAQLQGSADRSGAAAQLEMDRLRLPLQLGPYVDLSDTRMSGRLDLRLAGPPGAPWLQNGDLFLGGQVALSDLALRHPVLTSGSLPNLTLLIDGELQARGGPAGLVVSTPRLSLSLGELRLSLSGEVRRGPAGHGADLDLVLDELDCAQLFSALPRRLLPHLEGLGVRGQLGGQITLSYESRSLPDVDVRPAVDIGCQVVSDPPEANPQVLLNPELTIERASEDGRMRRLPLGKGAKVAAGTAPFQPLRGLPGPVVRTFLVAEDNQFYQHHGFDVQMMIRALGLDLQDQGTIRGASTITQQLAKNLWLGNERALGRKLEEAVLAWRLEQVVPKERILEAYLNLVELGSGIYGISRAAQHYFGVPASGLTLDQAAQLAALLPAPRRGMDGAWARRYRDILHRYGTALVPAP